MSRRRVTRVPEPQMNRVWIELEKPRDDAHADEICRKANRMLDRLLPPAEPGVDRSRFFWLTRDKRYAIGSYYGYYTLSDWGDWFNLDYLGRE